MAQQQIRFGELYSNMGLSNFPAKTSTMLATMNINPQIASKSMTQLKQHILDYKTPVVTLPTGAVWNLQAKTLTSGSLSNWGPFTQANSSKRPVSYTTGGFQNGAYVSFNGSSTFMYTYNQTFNAGTNGGHSIGMLIKFKTPVGAWERVIEGLAVGNNTNETFMIFRAGADPLMVFHAPAPTFQYPTDTFAQNTWYIWTYRFRNSDKNCVIKRDTTVLQNKTVTGNSVNFSINASFGVNSYGGDVSAGTTGQYGNFDIGALIIYDRPLSDTEMTNLYAYLSNGNAVK